jgi:thiosulfate dehydrogenase [quinone] large subunit
MLNVLKRKQHRVSEDPKFVKMLFGDARFSVLWLIVRVLIGWQWLEAGLHKVSDPGWVETGAALQGFWQRIVQIPEQGRPPITYDWYRDFIQSLLDAGAYTWFAKLVAYGEVLVGIALIIGAFVGIAAFFGAVMNFNFMLAGSASTNPVLLMGAIFLILAWKIAGFIGLDYWLLNWIGTPWSRGKYVEDESTPPQKVRSGAKA